MSKWQPIETMPEKIAVDVWIRSERVSGYGRRATGVCRIGDRWFGNYLPDPDYGEYPTHWMLLPAPPDADAQQSKGVERDAQMATD